MAAGVTNAAPMGGGLKIVAEASVTLTDNETRRITFPSPAKILISRVNTHTGWTGSTVNLADGMEYTGFTNLYVTLSSNGMYAEFRSQYSQAQRVMYLALG